MAHFQAVRRAASIAATLVFARGGDLFAAERPALALSYVASDPSCPSEREFLSRVQEKIDLAEPSDPRAPRVEAAVTLHGAGSAFTGQLTLRRPEESLYSREVRAGSCEELGAALAFVLALALEERRMREPPSAPSSPPVVVPPPAPEAPRRDAPVASDGSWKGSVVGFFGIRTGLSPTWSYAENVSLEIRREVTSGFAPTLRLGFAHAWPVVRIERAGQVRFTWIAARADACPLRWRTLASLDIVPCAVVHLGSIGTASTPSAAGIPSTDTHALWLDAAFNLRAEWRATRVLSLQAQGDAILPISRHRYAYDNPDTTVYQIPALAVAAYFGLGLHLP